MTPYYEDESVTLYHGDALRVLDQLPSASVAAIITDPPYSSGGQFRGDRLMDVKTKYVQNDSVSGHALTEFGGDSRDQRSYAYWCSLWLSEALRVTEPGGLLMQFTDWRQLPSTTDAIQAGGWVWRGIVPWYKPTARPQSGRFTASCEYVAWATAGPRAIDYDDPTFEGFYQASPPRERDHITQKPLDVMRKLVQIVPAGGVILDPFMGSGTTGVAAVLEGRRFVGIEQVEHFADIARQRITTSINGYRPAGDQMVLGVDGGDAA